MDLTPYVEHIRNELAVAAAAGGDEAHALAERLTASLESATRLTLLNVLSDAMGEVSRDLAPGSVDVHLRGLDPEFAVTPPPAPEPDEEAEREPAITRVSLPPPPEEGEESGTARISFRLPTHLKARVEDAAGQEGLSVNAWLVRAVSAALESGARPRTPGHGRQSDKQSYRGWVR